MSGKRFSLAINLLLAASFAVAQVPDTIFDRAVADLNQQKYKQAEETLRAGLAEHPRDARALGLMGVILDAQNRYAEAEQWYTQALAIDPTSASLLNNLGNHYLQRNLPDRARAVFLRVVAMEPNHANANLQLAQISVAAKQGTSALKYLDHLPASEQSEPAVQLLRLKALAYAGQRSRAEDLLAQLQVRAAGTPGLDYSAGLLLAAWGRYGDAEKAFASALHDNPADFEILYNLGLAAQKAGHLDRAREVFETALKVQPNDADCLLNLALIFAAQSQPEKAVTLLLEARHAAPQRADIPHALAQTSEQMGFYADAASALDEYLKLKPHDDLARRERGFCRAFGGDVDLGLEDLRWYTREHPKDARGLYELAIAETARAPGAAMQHLTRALGLDPKMTVGRYARAVLCYQQGKFSESIADLNLVLKSEPRNATAADMMGQDYMRLHQPEEAAKFLGQAADLSPRDPGILMHYSQALLRLGRNDEAQKVITRFKALEPIQTRERAQGGLFKFLDLPPEEQFSRYLTNLERAVNARPGDPMAKLRLGEALLDRGKIQEAMEAFRAASRQTSDPVIPAACGKALLARYQYSAAEEFLQLAVAADPSHPDARLDLAMAVSHSQNPEAGLRVLDGMPEGQRNGDYFLLRAQLLDSLRRPQEAAEALNRGIKASPTRPDLYFQAALFMVDHNQVQEMIDFLARADQVVPNNPQLWLTRAIGLAILHQKDQAAAILSRMESQWPEWYQPYLVHGVILAYALQCAQAKALLETAIALGARQPMAYYHLAFAMVTIDPPDVPGAQAVIREALALDAKDAHVQALAGKIAYLAKDYPAALEHLHAALETWPDMIEAHERLSATYRAMGDKEKSIAELKTVLRIKQQNPRAVQVAPFPREDLLFTVSEPGSAP